MKIRIGTELRLVPYINTYDRQPGLQKALPCKVVYINRPHRFFTVEFKFKFGSFREAYKFYERGDLCVKGEVEGCHRTWARGSNKHDLYSKW